MPGDTLIEAMCPILADSCDECNQISRGYCPAHGPLKWITDASTKFKSENESRARVSLPGDLHITPSVSGNEGLGVFTKKPVEERVVFGPFQGQKIPVQEINPEIMDQTYMWDVGAFHMFQNFSHQ